MQRKVLIHIELTGNENVLLETLADLEFKISRRRIITTPRGRLRPFDGVIMHHNRSETL